MTEYIDYPFHIDGRGRVGVTDVDDHVRDMIYQVLFTSPGERVNLPDFGCGLLQLTFMPNDDVLATTTQFLVQGALQRWLADVIEIEKVSVSNDNERLMLEVVYTRLDTGEADRIEYNIPAGSV